MNNKVNKFKCSLGAHPYKLLQINKNFEIKICKVCNKILEDWQVRSCITLNLNTPPKILKELSKDEDSSIRYLVAGNPKTPIEVLIELSKDEDEDVRLCAKENLKKRK